ncbi:hypothetical protein T459_27850 [Capsicum annuum]|uniref:RNase H type-1 domain-containing protein n=1 Tax=Capsicum annuum TaxID=4072 RepID=A0A2G2YF34_CAPAN|nr:hypothetical protein T459_27850 [Capsicum annuum]
MDELQLFRAITSFSMIYWKPLEVGWFIEYTDGASKANPDPNSIAFCIRDWHGDLLVAQGNRVRDTTSLETEVMAIKACLTYCRKHSISQLILESDSWNIVQILNVKWLTPWSLAMRVKPIKTLMESNFKYDNVEKLPNKGRAICKLDKVRTLRFPIIPSYPSALIAAAVDCKHHMTTRVYFGVVTNLVSEPKVLKYPRASECRIK